MKILMVCLGNICRSPIADGLLRRKVQEHNLDTYVDSAGTAAYHVGEAPDPRMQATGKNLGTPIDFLRARQFEVADFDQFDIIYAMDKSNYNNILKLARNQADEAKVKMILNESNPGMNLEVPDPYYGGDQGFVDVYNMLDIATDKIVEKYLK
ncbi:low molecular weight protein-tyrosine-phosphatase [Lishizhenia sp.]|uniref:low molecular weight protein-tyrosine-phosphatase n=1 Tax=Lishizhenia sp. TaxID=2497594 RepID=UPI00299CE3C6|nr:low molecular weight protein-tyrosine-phosphatase [Lishizhenia sp.]MDX1445684.1 low molecular weight protein-tyrosine-phosphatase [Lishizhenia sp.]